MVPKGPEVAPYELHAQDVREFAESIHGQAASHCEHTRPAYRRELVKAGLLETPEELPAADRTLELAHGAMDLISFQRRRGVSRLRKLC